MGDILYLGIFLFLVALSFFSKGFLIVKQAEVVIIERFGKFNCILYPGLHFIIPFIYKPHRSMWSFIRQVEDNEYHRYTHVITRIDLREAVYDFPKQHVITKDNVTMEINALLYYQIIDPKAAAYEISNLPEAIEKLTQTTLRNVIGSMDLDESLVSRDSINEKLTKILDEATDKWGVKVNRVELQEVKPPRDIQQAMEKQMRAERDRRAVILEAEGKKRAAILESEGEQESLVLRAKGKAESCVLAAHGEAEARLKIAEAEAKTIDFIQKVAPKQDALGYLIATKYVKAFADTMKNKNDKTVVVPYEMSSLIGSLASVKKLFTTLNE